MLRGRRSIWRHADQSNYELVGSEEMRMTDALGDLKLLDVREIWPNEAEDFTPWLAREENIALLGLALGLELEVENTEVAAGSFSADILARDTGSGAYVVIENQLGRTNHDHLGKAITYAAVLGAKTVVWVAPQFTDEHKKALDWLNDNSSDEISFFGVQPELWKIDESKPAIRFNILSRPTKVAIRKPGTELTEVRKLQLEWWTTFRDALQNSKEVPSVQSPRAQYWYNVALGRSGIHLSNIANTFDHKIGVRVYLRNKYNADLALAQLQESKEEIEREIGAPLLWNPNPDTMDKIIGVYRDADISRREKWSEYQQWMLDMTLRFRKSFGPRVKALNLESTDEDEPQDAEEADDGRAST